MRNPRCLAIIADSMRKNEWIFYGVLAASVSLQEIESIYGVAICTFLPLVFGVMAVGFWAFPKQKPSG